MANDQLAEDGQEEALQATAVLMRRIALLVVLARERDTHLRVGIGSSAQGHRLVPLKDHVILI